MLLMEIFGTNQCKMIMPYKFLYLYKMKNFIARILALWNNSKEDKIRLILISLFIIAVPLLFWLIHYHLTHTNRSGLQYLPI